MLKRRCSKLLLLFITIIICSFGIVAFSGLKKSTVENYIEYTRYVNKAEINILDSAYNKALGNYSKAFTLTSKPLAKHCFTAMQVAANQDNLPLFKQYTTLGIKRGLLPRFFAEDSLLNGYIHAKKLSSYIEKQYSTYHKFYEASLNKVLNDTMRRIVWDEMKWKNMYLDSLARVDPSNEKKYAEIYDSIVKDVVEGELFPLIEKYGYPDERNCGIDKSGMQPYRYSLDNGIALLSILHYYSFPRSCKYNKLLHDELIKGNLLPRQYATIMDFQAKYSQGECSDTLNYNQWYFITDTSKLKEINKRRQNIGLSAFEFEELKRKRGQKVCSEIKKGNYKHIKLYYWCG